MHIPPNKAGGSDKYSLCTKDGATRAAPASPPDGGVDEVIRQADQLVRDSHLDAAAALYRYRLEKDPTDACAAQGLAFIAALPPAERTTKVGAAAGRWDDFYQSRIVPGFTILVPFAVVLAVLLGLVHLLTRRVVTPDTVVLHDRPTWRERGELNASTSRPSTIAMGRPVLRWVGLAALLVAAWLVTTHFYTAGGNPVTRWVNAALCAAMGGG